MFRVRNTAETIQTPARPESHNDLTVGRAARSFRRKLGATRNPSEQLLSCARGGAGEALTIDLLAAQSACAGAARAGWGSSAGGQELDAPARSAFVHQGSYLQARAELARGLQAGRQAAHLPSCIAALFKCLRG